MAKKVTISDSLKGGHYKANPYQGGARAPGAPPGSAAYDLNTLLHVSSLQDNF